MNIRKKMSVLSVIKCPFHITYVLILIAINASTYMYSHDSVFFNWNYWIELNPSSTVFSKN